jgi:hypothetical protein
MELAPPRIRTFRHRFRGRTVCEMSIDLDKLCRRETDYLHCVWSKKPKMRVIPEYRRWILSVHSTSATRRG